MSPLDTAITAAQRTASLLWSADAAQPLSEDARAEARSAYEALLDVLSRTATLLHLAGSPGAADAERAVGPPDQILTQSWFWLAAAYAGHVIRLAPAVVMVAGRSGAVWPGIPDPLRSPARSLLADIEEALGRFAGLDRWLPAPADENAASAPGQPGRPAPTIVAGAPALSPPRAGQARPGPGGAASPAPAPASQVAPAGALAPPPPYSPLQSWAEIDPRIRGVWQYLELFYLYLQYNSQMLEFLLARDEETARRWHYVALGLEFLKDVLAPLADLAPHIGWPALAGLVYVADLIEQSAVRQAGFEGVRAQAARDLLPEMQRLIPAATPRGFQIRTSAVQPSFASSGALAAAATALREQPASAFYAGAYQPVPGGRSPEEAHLAAAALAALERRGIPIDRAEFDTQVRRVISTTVANA